jgi:acyl carrier protein
MEEEKFLEQFIAQFDDEPTGVTMDTDFRDIDDWDSLTALGVISMIDDEYNVKLSGEELKSSNSVRDIFNIVKTKVG